VSILPPTLLSPINPLPLIDDIIITVNSINTTIAVMIIIIPNQSVVLESSSEVSKITPVAVVFS